jgi:hypothetical protein
MEISISPSVSRSARFDDRTVFIGQPLVVVDDRSLSHRVRIKRDLCASSTSPQRRTAKVTFHI